MATTLKPETHTCKATVKTRCVQMLKACMLQDQLFSTVLILEKARMLTAGPCCECSGLLPAHDESPWPELTAPAD